MPRQSKLSINPDTIAMLQEAAQSENSSLIRHRAEVLLRLYVDSWSIVKIAKHYKLSRNTITNWYTSFETDGLNGLENRPRSGRPIIASASYIKALEELLQQPPPYHDFHGWVIPLISDEMEAQTNIKLSQDALRDLLHGRGYKYMKEAEQHPTVTMEQLVAESLAPTGLTIKQFESRSPLYTWRKPSR